MATGKKPPRRRKKYTKRTGEPERWEINLKRLRRERRPRITQEEIAARADVSHYHLIETGRRRPREATLKKLCDAFTALLGRDVTPGEIMGDARADAAVNAYEQTLAELLQEETLRPGELENLREKAKFPEGRPTLEGWKINLQIMRLEAKLHGQK